MWPYIITRAARRLLGSPLIFEAKLANCQEASIGAGKCRSRTIVEALFLSDPVEGEFFRAALCLARSQACDEAGLSRTYTRFCLMSLITRHDFQICLATIIPFYLDIAISQYLLLRVIKCRLPRRLVLRCPKSLKNMSQTESKLAHSGRLCPRLSIRTSLSNSVFHSKLVQSM